MRSMYEAPQLVLHIIGAHNYLFPFPVAEAEEKGGLIPSQELKNEMHNISTLIIAF